MSRIARIVVPGLVYHITHRGNRRQNLFYRPEDRELYKRLLAKYCERYGLEIWSYCLMTNHVHHVAVPRHEDSLARAIGVTHGRFAQWQNREHKWTGHLWENRYYSSALDAEHVWAAVRYVEQNPVRAGLVERAELYTWSSAPCHALGLEDSLLAPTRPFPGEGRDWSRFLARNPNRAVMEELRRNTSRGLPTGSKDFIKRLESELDRRMRRRSYCRRNGDGQT